MGFIYALIYDLRVLVKGCSLSDILEYCFVLSEGSRFWMRSSRCSGSGIFSDGMVPHSTRVTWLQ